MLKYNRQTDRKHKNRGLMRLPADASSLKKVSNQQLTTLGNIILMIHVYLYPRMNYSTLGESFGLKS